MNETHPARRTRRGNAYLVTVMVMIIVTILGLSLGAVTQTEMLIGSKQRNNQRIFFAAEGGMDMSVARLMVQGDTRPIRVSWTIPPAYDTGVPMEAVIRMAPIRAVTMPPCNFCEVAGSTEANTKALYNIRSAVTIRAALQTETQQVLAQRRLHNLVDIQPMQPQGLVEPTLDPHRDEINERK